LRRLKTTRNILLAISLIFVLLHSFLPHVHQSDNANKLEIGIYDNSESISSILRAICTDIGKGHLEHFQACKDLDFSAEGLNFAVLFQFQRHFECFSLKHIFYKEQKSQAPFAHFSPKTQAAKCSPTIGRAPPFSMIHLG